MRRMILFSLLSFKIVSVCAQDTTVTNLHQKILYLDSLAAQMDSLLNNASENKIHGNSEIGHYEGSFKTLAEKDDIGISTISLNFSASPIIVYSTNSKTFKLHMEEGSYYYISGKFYENPKAGVTDATIARKLLALVKIHNTICSLFGDK